MLHISDQCKILLFLVSLPSYKLYPPPVDNNTEIISTSWIETIMCHRNDSVILGAQRDGITDSVAIAKKTGLQVQTHGQ